MTPRQVTIVQTTFEKVAPISEAAARLFYDKLFELDPGLRQLFSTDMSEQGRKLMQMLAFCVKGLHRLDILMPSVRALGARHVEYQVIDSDYDTVGEAMLWTLEKELGAEFTPEVEDAWAAAYVTLSNAMRTPAAAE